MTVTIDDLESHNPAASKALTSSACKSGPGKSSDPSLVFRLSFVVDLWRPGPASSLEGLVVSVTEIALSLVLPLVPKS